MIDKRYGEQKTSLSHQLHRVQGGTWKTDYETCILLMYHELWQARNFATFRYKKMNAIMTAATKLTVTLTLLSTAPLPQGSSLSGIRDPSSTLLGVTQNIRAASMNPALSPLDCANFATTTNGIIWRMARSYVAEALAVSVQRSSQYGENAMSIGKVLKVSDLDTLAASGVGRLQLSCVTGTKVAVDLVTLMINLC